MDSTDADGMPSLIEMTQAISLNTQRLLIGYFLNWMLFGVLSVQTYLYFVAFPKDRLFTKMTVGIVYALESVQTFLVTADGFKTLAVGFGNILSLNAVDISWFGIPVMTGTISFVVQIIYVYRIYVLSGSKTICGTILFLSLFQLGGAFSTAIQTKHSNGLIEILNHEQSLIGVGIWEGSSAVCDIIIAGCMTYYLRIRESGFKKTQDIIRRIIRLSIGTGTVTATLAIVTLVLVYLPGHQLYWIPIVMVLAKAYSNSIMVVLNSRMKVVSYGPQPTWNEIRTERELQSIFL